MSFGFSNSKKFSLLLVGFRACVSIIWLNVLDGEQTKKVKEALHVSTSPSVAVCREDEQKKVLDFCKACIEQDKAGSLYVCGCPGTGKSLSMEKVKRGLVDWAEEVGFLPSTLVITFFCFLQQENK